MPIQLPDDVKATGYKQVKPFDWQQVFYSAKFNFQGTEQDFLRAGLAYEYVQVAPFKHICKV